MTDDDVAKDGIAFAIAYADNCEIPEGFANDKKYDNQDWMSDWAAYLAEAVWDELKLRRFKISRIDGASRDQAQGLPVGPKGESRTPAPSSPADGAEA